MKPSTDLLTVETVIALSEDWIADAICRQHSRQTIDSRRHITSKFVWWLRHEGYVCVGPKEIRRFLAYVGSPAPAGGRWGNPHETRDNRPRTVHTYWERLHTLFRWGVEQELLASSPMEKIGPPVTRRDQIQPFTEPQVQALLNAAARSRHPQRDTAICLLLLDTGVRASELCTLQLKDLDLENGQATVLGKGNKRRTVYFDEAPKLALQTYLDVAPRRITDPVFHGERGPRLTRSGLQQLVHRLGRSAGLTGVRCSPHTFRHTSAIWSIRSGMNSFALQTMLGHTDLTMTRRYVAIAQADLEDQHRRFSPVRRLSTSHEAGSH